MTHMHAVYQYLSNRYMYIKDVYIHFNKEHHMNIYQIIQIKYQLRLLVFIQLYMNFILNLIPSYDINIMINYRRP